MTCRSTCIHTVVCNVARAHVHKSVGNRFLFLFSRRNRYLYNGVAIGYIHHVIKSRRVRLYFTYLLTARVFCVHTGLRVRNDCINTPKHNSGRTDFKSKDALKYFMTGIVTFFNKILYVQCLIIGKKLIRTGAISLPPLKIHKKNMPPNGSADGIRFRFWHNYIETYTFRVRSIRKSNVFRLSMRL